VFDSPLEWCGVCRQWVALDQSFAERARQHGCELESCPLARMLKGRDTEFRDENGLELR